MQSCLCMFPLSWAESGLRRLGVNIDWLNISKQQCSDVNITKFCKQQCSATFIIFTILTRLVAMLIVRCHFVAMCASSKARIPQTILPFLQPPGCTISINEHISTCICQEIQPCGLHTVEPP